MDHKFIVLVAISAMLILVNGILLHYKYCSNKDEIRMATPEEAEEILLKRLEPLLNDTRVAGYNDGILVGMHRAVELTNPEGAKTLPEVRIQFDYEKAQAEAYARIKARVK